jgi:hypothetical protein
MKRGRSIVAALLGLSLLAGGTAAAAEAPTRDEYVSALEAVCRPDVEATQRAMRGARGDIKFSRLDAAAAKFAQGTAIFGATVDEIEAAPRPTADAAKLSKWFGYLRTQEAYLKQITAQLRRGHGVKAQRLTARFIHNGNLANNTVLAFGFDYCAFRFSRFG